ncbi:MAG: MmcQ/YjbR family DNA-binding protein [Nitrospiraceae bacterium]|nr:MmcQ/YjbR family DNA-binding protein [Nitrospiraceae bacterium]
MNIEELREYCLRKKEVTEELPFDEDTLVFKVMGKMFLLTDIEKADSINIKCDPLKAIELREQYAAVMPGWHMNKRPRKRLPPSTTTPMIQSAKLRERFMVQSSQLIASSHHRFIASSLHR